MIEQAALEVENVPTRLSTTTLAPNGDEIGPHTVVVQVVSDSAAGALLGAADVSVANPGILVAPGETFAIDLERNEYLYVVSADDAAAASLRVMRVNV